MDLYVPLRHPGGYGRIIGSHADGIVAEFLRSKFLASFAEAEDSKLFSSSPGFSGPISCLKAIKDIIGVIDMQTAATVYSNIDMQRGGNTSCVVNILDKLNQLNEALAEIRIVANEFKEVELNKKLLLCNPVTNCYFMPRMKRLAKQLEYWKILQEKLEIEKYINSREQNDQHSSSRDRAQVVEQSSPVLGFDDEEENIQRLLFGAAKDKAFTAIGIIGEAGSGKTTLMKMVLNSKRVKDEFCTIVVLQMSEWTRGRSQFTRDDFVKYFFNLLRGVIFPEKDYSYTLDLGKMLENLRQNLSGKRYLFVMDDVWDNIDGLLSHLGFEGGEFGGRLSNGLPKDSGGAVIVTSRITEVARDMVGSQNLVRVKPLDGETCWHIFMASIPSDIYISTHQTLRKIKNEIKDRCHGLPLAAKKLAQVIPIHIHEIQSKRDIEVEMYIPDELLTPDSSVPVNVAVPKHPVLVLIDMTNKQLGKRVLGEFSDCLNEKQVYGVLQGNHDDPKQNPERIVKEFYGTLEKLKSQGYGFASEIQNRMRVIIVSGDAVANWIMGAICDLKLPEPPSIALIRLGTKNFMAHVYGMSSSLITDEKEATRSNVKNICVAVQGTKPTKTDSWQIRIRSRGLVISTANQELDSWHLLRPANETDMRRAENQTFCGKFWNYFSLGVDPPSQGWHMASCVRPATARPLTLLAKVMVLKHVNQEWEVLHIPSSINSILCHNLQCLQGGLRPWRGKNTKKDQKKHLTASFVDDGRLEIIGCKEVMLPQNAEWVRLEQVAGIRFEFSEGAADQLLHMAIDGAPWNKIPLNNLAEIEISYYGQVTILGTKFHQAKSVHAQRPPRSAS